MSDTPQQQALAEKDLGNTAYKQRKFEEALAHYSKAWELDNTNITFLTNKAAVLFEEEKYDECIQVCHEAVDHGRELRADYKLIARALQRIGNAYVKQALYVEAIQFYQKSLTEHRTPDTLQKLRDTEKLKKEAEKAAYYNPELADQARESGNALFKQSKWPEAIEQYTEAIKRNDKDVRPYSNRAACYLKLLAVYEAQKDAEACIALDPTFARGYLRKAAVEFAKKEYDSALKILDEAEVHDTDGKCAREIYQQRTKVQRAMIPEHTEGDSREDVLNRAAQDPEIQRIMSDPIMQQILKDMQQDPKAAQEHLKNPQVAANIRKLMAAGILRMG
ncbi:hypothetical protein BDF14DRAFT_1868849 [Spinellus fusiger]|nr:hypothetical protein BDF14DRAFT_1868849 [Spinellus fusiger]